jgi:hypothetical protein
MKWRFRGKNRVLRYKNSRKQDLALFTTYLILTLIEASRPVIDTWIMEHYDELVVGINCSEALRTKPNELKAKSFQLQLKDKCERKQIKREWHYVLKNEVKKLYYQIDLNE